MTTVRRASPSRPVSSAARQVGVASGRIPQVDVDAGAPSTASLSAKRLPDVAGLPTDPQALLRTLESGAYGAPMIHPPRSALWASFCRPQRHLTCASLGSLPGSRTDSRKERSGRSPTTLVNRDKDRLTKDGVRSELIVDPSSGQLLGTEDVAFDPSAASEALIQSARVVPAGTSFLGGALWTLGSLRQFLNASTIEWSNS